MPEEWKGSIIVPIYKQGNKIRCSNYGGISHLSNTYKILANILLSRLTPYAEEFMGIISVDFDATDQLLFILFMYTKLVKRLIKYGNMMKQCISYL